MLEPMPATPLVRLAQSHEADLIVALVERVQAHLTASGSLQIIGPIPREVVAAQIAARTAHLLELDGRVVGSVFVEPASLEHFRTWGLIDPHLNYWFLQKLMLEPAFQGQGLGYPFIEALKAHLATQEQPALLALDCWAGNQNLRSFYQRAGFELQGVFSDGGADFEVAVFTWLVK